MLETYVENLLKKTLSPEQIAGYMRRSGHTQALCHKTIYAWVHRRWSSRKAYLRFKGRPRVQYGQHKRLWQPHRRHISDRPRIVDRRLRVGDWEADLVHGIRDDSRHCILTLNERMTGFAIARKLRTLNPLAVSYIMADALRDLPVKTITCDNGFEFGQHKTIEKLLKCEVYFTDTHSPQQRGSNENFNGLLREFFPKGTSLGCGLIKPEPEADASDFDHCKIVESTAVVSRRDMSELLELIEAALNEVALLVFGFAIGDAVVTV